MTTTSSDKSQARAGAKALVRGLKTLAAGLALSLGLGAAGQALAQCCAAPPAPCCAPPPAPPTPSKPCCGAPSHNIHVPGVNVYVAPSVIVNASARATAIANANASAGSGAGAGAGASSVVYFGGGGSRSYVAPGAAGIIQNLNVEGGGVLKRSAYEATRTRTRRVVIQAFCIDGRGVPHAASQVRPDREIADDYEGELYRCIAGTRLQYVIADYDGKVAFDGGRTSDCAKGEALYLSRGGALECRRQKPARDCNERSLLRRYGAGIKILTLVSTETYTAFREEHEATSFSSSASMTLDGGVGGVMY